MINVYYKKVSPFWKEDTFWSQWNRIEERRKEKILRLSNNKEKARSLSAGSLLHYALCMELDLQPDTAGAFSVEYEGGGKPFLTDYPETYFNLSHSGDYVVCGVGREPLGVDIQKHTVIRKGIADRFFTSEDNRRLSDCKGKEREELFFRMWSIKESYIKLTGRGMSKGLDSFEIDWKQRAIFEGEETNLGAFFEENSCLPGYSLCVCCKTSGQTVTWKELSSIFCD